MAKLKVLSSSFSVAALGGLAILALMAGSPAPQHMAVPTQPSAAKTPAVPQIAPAPTREATARVVYTGPVIMISEAATERLAASPAGVPVVPTSPTATPAPVSVEPQDALPQLAPARLMGEEVAAPATAVPQAAPKPSDEAPIADEAAARGVDLNSASAEELNGLGGGRIGRAIVNGRPYRSPDDLLQKRVLTRATYEQIKEQIIVQ